MNPLNPDMMGEEGVPSDIPTEEGRYQFYSLQQILSLIQARKRSQKRKLEILKISRLMGR